MILCNDGLVAFHYKSYGIFFYPKIGSIISTGDLTTTNIIEPCLFLNYYGTSFLFNHFIVLTQVRWRTLEKYLLLLKQNRIIFSIIYMKFFIFRDLIVCFWCKIFVLILSTFPIFYLIEVGICTIQELLITFYNFLLE